MLHGDGVSLLGDEIVWELDDGNSCKTLNILNIYLIYIGISNGKFCVIQFYNNKKNERGIICYSFIEIDFEGLPW